MRDRVFRGALAIIASGQIALFVQAKQSGASGEAAERAVDWFLSNKAPDGALPSYGNGYTVGGTADGVLALAAAGENPARFGRKSGETPIQYLEAHAADDTSDNDPRDDAHLAGKVALAAAAAGKDPRDFGKANLVEFMTARYDPSSGGYRGSFTNFEITPFGQALAVMGMIASDEPVPSKAVHYLVSSQIGDGGWDSSGFGTDVQTSSLALQALVAAANALGEPDGFHSAVVKANDFFEKEQNPDGGFSYKKAYAGNFCSGIRPSEVDSTGMAIQAIRALGQAPADPPWNTFEANPKQFLESVQNPDGSFSFQEGPDCEGNGGSTYTALLGLREASFVCLLELGTCPPRKTSRRGEGTTNDPPAEEALRGNDLPEPPPPEVPNNVPQRKPAPAPLPPAKAPIARAKTVAAPRPAGSCGRSVCSGAAVPPTPVASPTPVAKVAAGPTGMPAGDPGSTRSGAEEPLSGRDGAGSDPVVWAGLGVILVLAGSIGRQLMKGRR